MRRPLKPRQPASNLSCIRIPVIRKFPGEPGLFKKNHAQVERNRKNYEISPKPLRTAPKTPSGEKQDNPDVHWISNESIETNYDKALRSVPGSQGPLPYYQEITNAPKQDSDSDNHQRSSGSQATRTGWVRLNNPPGNQSGKNSRKDQHSENCTDKHFHVRPCYLLNSLRSVTGR